MQLLELSLPTAAENIALDEALLLSCEQDSPETEILRIWEPPGPLVVLGRSSRAGDEVDLEACRRDKIPVVRRTSGGTAIVGAAGCLMYATVLSYARRPELKAIDRAHRFVLESLCAALEHLAPALCHQKISDLAFGDRKVSGNSLRCLKTHLLYHGTLLYHMPLNLISRYLRQPPRQPAYRRGRSHEDFMSRLPVTRKPLVQAIRTAFGPTTPLTDWPRELTAQLVAEKYSRDAWNFLLA